MFGGISVMGGGEMTLHLLYRYVYKVCWDIYSGGGEMTLHMLYRYVCKVCWDIYCGTEITLHIQL